MKASSRGSTLVEVMIGMLLTAVITLSIFSVALTTKKLGVRVERKVVAANATRRLLEELKNYVAMDPITGTHANMGPNQGAGAGNTWQFPGSIDRPAGTTAAYALAPIGDLSCDNTLGPNEPYREVLSYLPSEYTPAPVSMKIAFQVADSEGNYGASHRLYKPRVSVCVWWTEPVQ